MTDPGLPDSPEPQDSPPGGDPGSVPETDLPGEDDLVKTSDELDGRDAESDAAAQEEDQQPADADGDGALEDDESATVTNAGVIGQAGIGNA
jgi:hypothetical protein